MRYCLLLFVPLLLGATHQEPEKVLKNLIEVTERALEGEKRLIVLVGEFEQAQNNVASGVGGNKEAAKLVHLARAIDALIEEWSLHDYFSGEFVNDVAVLAGMGRKPMASKQ